MNVETIQMPRADAEAALRTYRSQLETRLSAEVRADYERIETAYAALAEGTPLIDLHRAIGGAGVDTAGRPVLAVCRADRKSTRWTSTREDIVFDASARPVPSWGPPDRRRRAPWMVVRVPRAVFSVVPNGREDRAVAPLIPAEVREAVGRFDPRGHLLLWEAVWEPSPPIDPMLLRPIGGTLCAVLAAWDLTEVERAVLAGRISG